MRFLRDEVLGERFKHEDRFEKVFYGFVWCLAIGIVLWILVMLVLSTIEWIKP